MILDRKISIINMLVAKLKLMGSQLLFLITLKYMDFEMYIIFSANCRS